MKNAVSIPKLMTVSLALASLFQCISVGPANAFLGIFYLFALITLIQNRGLLADLYSENKSLAWVSLFFLMTFLPSVFYAGKSSGWSEFFSQYVVRMVPLFVILAVIKDKRAAFVVFLAAVLSFLIDTAASPFMGFKWGRLRGIYGHFMIYAGFACIILPALMTAFVFSSTKLQKIGWGLVNIACFAILFLNGARGAWIAIALACLILFILNMKRLKTVLVFVVVLAVVALILGWNFAELSNRAATVTTVNNSLNTERLLMWKSAWNMFVDHPLTGVGLSNYGDAYTQAYIQPEATLRGMTRAHSNIFQILGESGIIALIGFFVLFGYLAVSSLRRYLTTKNVFGLLVFLSTVALMTQGLTEFNLAHSNVMKFFWTYTACCWILMRLPESESVALLTSPVTYLKNLYHEYRHRLQ
jgi:O-antigen ligase